MAQNQIMGGSIGSELIAQINGWTKESQYEFIIVWLSDEGIDFYIRNVYEHCKRNDRIYVLRYDEYDATR